MSTPEDPGAAWSAAAAQVAAERGVPWPAEGVPDDVDDDADDVAFWDEVARRAEHRG